MDNTFQSPAIISICPGLLGIERGLKRCGIIPRVAAYVEIEAFIIANLVAGMESGMVDPAPVWTDAKTFNPYPFRGKIHGITGGYPCPGESLAGLREGHLYKGFIWPAIRKAIHAIRPFWCFFENVDDHLSGTYPIVRRSLQNMGYTVEAGIFSAEEVGATHERKRLFILALENSYVARFWREYAGGFPAQIIGAGKELADTYGDGNGTVPETSSKKGSKVKKTQYGQAGYDLFGEWLRGKPGNVGSELANANSSQWRPDNPEGNQDEGQSNIFRRSESSNSPSQCGGELANAGGTGSQGMQPELVRREGQGISGPITECRPQDFPIGQGNEQWEWEEPRTIESGMGCAIDGYNFREDLLRALGNSVVEQQAEIAFLNLINKHLANAGR